ncbi:MAG: hypothetical protein ACRDF4_01415 [Rhabdochlamydiaceae bacterium]
MRKYCKAYHLKDLRQFASWQEVLEVGEEPLSDDAIVYLWDDFTVVTSPVLPEKKVLWDTVTPEWQAFCNISLHFEIPDDLRYAYEQPQEQKLI